MNYTICSWKQLRILLRSTSLFLIVLATFGITFSGCAFWGTKPDIKPISRDCMLNLKYIDFSDESEIWIRNQNPPQHVNDTLNEIAKNNIKLVKGCDNISKPK